MHAYTYGGWAHRQRVSTTFLTRKISQVFLVLLTGFELMLWNPLDLESDALPIKNKFEPIVCSERNYDVLKCETLHLP